MLNVFKDKEKIDLEADCQQQRIVIGPDAKNSVHPRTHIRLQMFYF